MIAPREGAQCAGRTAHRDHALRLRAQVLGADRRRRRGHGASQCCAGRAPHRPAEGVMSLSPDALYTWYTWHADLAARDACVLIRSSKARAKVLCAVPPRMAYP